MSYYDIDPQDIDPETNRPYANYSTASLDTSFHDGEIDDGDCPYCEEGRVWVSRYGGNDPDVWAVPCPKCGDS